MADSTDWVKTADAMKTLQAEWKAIGPVTRGNEKAVWERFRAACDKFFTRRQDDLKQRKQDWTENLKRKEALVAEAEAAVGVHRVGAGRLAHQAAAGRLEGDRSGEEEQVRRDLERVPRRVRSVLRALQESRSGGAAGQDGRSRSRGHRARGACCRPPMPPTRRRPTISTPRCRRRAPAGCRAPSCRATRWRRSPSASTRALFALVTRWPDGFKGTDLDPEQTKGQMEKLIAKVEKQLPDRKRAEPAKNLSPAELLARQWREALAANTMGAGAGTPGRRRASARRRAGSAQRPGGVGASRSARARAAQAAAGSFRSRGPQVLRDAPPVGCSNLHAAWTIDFRVRHAIYRSFAEGGDSARAAIAVISCTFPMRRRSAQSSSDCTPRHAIVLDPRTTRSLDGAAVLGGADADFASSPAAASWFANCAWDAFGIAILTRRRRDVVDDVPGLRRPDRASRRGPPARRCARRRAFRRARGEVVGQHRLHVVDDQVLQVGRTRPQLVGASRNADRRDHAGRQPLAAGAALVRQGGCRRTGSHGLANGHRNSCRTRDSPDRSGRSPGKLDHVSITAGCPHPGDWPAEVRAQSFAASVRSRHHSGVNSTTPTSASAGASA